MQSRLLPVWGILLFATLYSYAATLYPGGSQADLHHPGFDWVHNYWCNLLNPKAMNGAPNPARPFAIAAMGLLCASLALFFHQFQKCWPVSPGWDAAIRICGLMSTASGLFIFTSWHDGITIFSSAFGLIAIIGVFTGLYRHRLKKHLAGSLACAVLLVGNNFIYYSGYGLFYLPLVQKMTFAAGLIWVAWLCLETPAQKPVKAGKH